MSPRNKLGNVRFWLVCYILFGYAKNRNFVKTVMNLRNCMNHLEHLVQLNHRVLFRAVVAVLPPSTRHTTLPVRNIPSKDARILSPLLGLNFHPFHAVLSEREEATVRLTGRALTPSLSESQLKYTSVLKSKVKLSQ
jgi:hypothetical protein